MSTSGRKQITINLEKETGHRAYTTETCSQLRTDGQSLPHLLCFDSLWS